MSKPTVNVSGPPKLQKQDAIQMPTLGKQTANMPTMQKQTGTSPSKIDTSKPATGGSST